MCNYNTHSGQAMKPTIILHSNKFKFDSKNNNEKIREVLVFPKYFSFQGLNNLTIPLLACKAQDHEDQLTFKKYKKKLIVSIFSFYLVLKIDECIESGKMF